MTANSHDSPKTLSTLALIQPKGFSALNTYARLDVNLAATVECICRNGDT